MARLIVKSPYIQCGGGQGADGYMRYIATRERVEIIPDGRPPTRKQEQLITKLAKDFPNVKELLEYQDYAQHPTKVNASRLITLALEENWSKVKSSEGYARYIATGLVQSVWGIMVCSEMRTAWIWTKPWQNWNTTPETCGRTFLSLHREDAARLGYDNAQGVAFAPADTPQRHRSSHAHPAAGFSVVRCLP